MQRVVAYTDTVHEASRHVMEKSGMTPVRTFLAPLPELPGGPDEEAIEYALSKADWEQQVLASTS